MYFTVPHIEKAPIHNSAVLCVLFAEFVKHCCFLRLLLLSGMEPVAKKPFHLFLNCPHLHETSCSCYIRHMPHTKSACRLAERNICEPTIQCFY
jgi:hypothetical protein